MIARPARSGARLTVSVGRAFRKSTEKEKKDESPDL